jgi:hypothetical protein
MKAVGLVIAVVILVALLGVMGYFTLRDDGGGSGRPFPR